MRKLASIVVSAGVLVSLSACAAGPSTFADCGPSGNAALVSAKGSFGADPSADFPTPLVAKSAEVAQIRPGDGDDISVGSTVYGTVSIYDGESGEALGGQSPLIAVPILATTASGRYPFAEAFSCVEVGARVAISGTNAELFGGEGLGGDTVADQTLVIVADVTDVFLGRANGADQLAQDGMPAVVLSPSGQPGFTFPDTAPTEFTSSLLKRGSGVAVADGDNVVVNYTTIAWGASTTTTSSWTDGLASPAILSLDGSDTASFTAQVKEAIIGAPVGSQVLIVAPGEPALVYVVDVLGIVE